MTFTWLSGEIQLQDKLKTMGKLVIGSFMFLAGIFFLATGIGMIIGIPLFIGGLGMGVAGMLSLGGTAVKTGVIAGKATIAAGKAIKGTKQNGSPKSATAIDGNYDRKKWNTLKEIDPDIRAAANRLNEYGNNWEDELADRYLSLNDKKYLDDILSAVIQIAESDGTLGEPEQVSAGDNLLVRESDGTYTVVSGVDRGKRFEDYETVVEYYELANQDESV